MRIPLSPLSKKIFVALLIIYLISVIIMIVYLNFQINEVKKNMAIGNFDFEKNELVNINFARVYGQGTDIVSPNDELELKMEVTNKEKYTIVVQPKVFTEVGGVIEKSVENTKETKLEIGDTKSISESFFAAEGGKNKIITKLIISHTNGTIIAIEDTNTVINVVPITILIQQQSNETSRIQLISSMVIAISALAFTMYQVIKQRNEKNQTIRPWIGEITNTLEISKYYNEKQDVKFKKQWDSMGIDERKKFKCTEVQWKISLKNFGKYLQ